MVSGLEDPVEEQPLEARKARLWLEFNRVFFPEGLAMQVSIEEN